MKKNDSFVKKEKKERRRKGQESGRGFCSSASAFLSPWCMGLINFIEFALICGGPLAGQRLPRPQIVFLILGPLSQCLAFLSIDESPLFKVLCHVSHFFVFDLSSESIFFFLKRKLSRNNICKGLTITYSQALIIYYIYIYIKENIKRKVGGSVLYSGQSTQQMLPIKHSNNAKIVIESSFRHVCCVKTLLWTIT